MVLRVLRPASSVQRPSSSVHRPLSGVRRPASSVRSTTPTVLKLLSPYCTHIFVMYIRCAQKNIVAPPIILNFLFGHKQFLTF